MSSESNDDDASTGKSNAEVRQELLQKHRELEAQEELEQHQRAATAASARQTIAEEEPPDDTEGPVDLRKTYEVEFRGHPFEFYELGDSQVKAASFQAIDDEVEQGSKTADFLYTTMGEKCAGGPGDPTGEMYGEDWWRRYDVSDIMGVFQDLVEEATDISEEERKKIEEFRNQ